MADANDVAAAVLSELGEMTTMKLQKLVYYCQAWHVAQYRTPLFAEQIQAWKQGPVVPALWDRHRKSRTVAEWPWGDAANLNENERATLAWVVAKYGRFSAERLSRMSHHEIPWRIARGALPDAAPSDAPISLNDMRRYFARQRVDADTAASLASASAALEGVELDDEWQSKLRSVADGSVSAEDLIAIEIARAKRD